jgi:hypothetical protein
MLYRYIMEIIARNSMKDINDVINKAEENLDRLRLQAEQEAAMKEIMPIRFDNNMAFFEQYVPHLAREFKEYQPQKAFEFFCTENGIPNLRWLDNGQVFYEENPYIQTLNQVTAVLESASLIRFNMQIENDNFQQKHVQFMNKLINENIRIQTGNNLLNHVPESVPLCLMFGVGLGYQLAYLYERCTPANVFIFEPDSDLFYASLFTFDWSSLLSYLLENNLGVHFFVGKIEEDIILDLREVLFNKWPFICATTFGFVHYNSDTLFRIQARVSKELYLLSMGWGFFDDNLFSLSHSLSNIENKVHLLRKKVSLPARVKTTPVFVIANGPSLDGSIEFLKTHADKILIVACGTAITALHKVGIKPDIYIAVERVSVVPDSLATLNDTEYLRDVLLIGPDILHPDCQGFFDRSIYAFKAEEPMWSLLFANTNLMDVFARVAFINPLVGNGGVSFPLHFGFERLYLVGLDNGFKSHQHHHSRFSLYYDDKGDTKDQFKNMALAQGAHVLPGNFGGEVVSNTLFSASVMMLDVAVSYFPHARCFNCSDGAAIKGATPLDIQDIDLSLSPVLDKKEIIDFLYNEMSAPADISKEEIQKYMDVEFLDILMEKIKAEWQVLPAQRLLFVQLMQTQMEYLSQVSLSRQRHIAGVLFGSFSSIFTLVTHTLYSVEEEEKALELVDELKPLIIEFFNTMQKLYKHGLDMIQGRHFKILENLEIEQERD